MNIKEIEERSGLPRSGIRYYEAEGLLNPARLENGYRDYSEADLETLMKIKRLRGLGRGVAVTDHLIQLGVRRARALCAGRGTRKRRQQLALVGTELLRCAVELFESRRDGVIKVAVETMK